MNKPILTVTLNPALDRTIVVKDFKAGKTFLKDEEFVSAGGKGLNVSRALQHLQVKNIATGFLGGDSAKVIKHLIKEERIPSDFVDIQGPSRVNFTIVDRTNVYKKTRILGIGPKTTKKDIQGFIHKYKQHLEKSSWVVLSGRNPNGASDSLYSQLIDFANKAGIPSVLDTSGGSLKKGIYAKPTIVKPNKEELEELFLCRLSSLKKIRNAIIALHNITGKIVLLSMASKGAIGFNGKEIVRAIPPKVKAVNDVGCGDAFLAGYLFSLEKIRSFEESLICAVAAGTANAMTFIPGLITQRDLIKLSKKIQLTKI